MTLFGQIHLNHKEKSITETMVGDTVVDTGTSPRTERRSTSSRGTASLTRADQIEAEQVEWLWQDLIPFGAITILAGNPGLGKSLLTVWLAAKLSRGELGGGGPASVLLSSAEDPRAQVVVPRLRAAGAVMEHVHFIEVNRDGFQTPPLLPDDVAEVGRQIEIERARLLVIDPLMAHLAAGINSWKDQEIRTALLPLKTIAEEMRTAVVVVQHLNKGNSTDPLQRLGGSIGLPAAARSVLLLGRDPDDPDGVEGDRRVLAHVKSNIGPKTASLALRIESVEAETGSVGRIVQHGYSPHSGEDLLNEAPTNRGSKRTAAIEFLLDRLGTGPMSVGDLQDAAGALDISPTTLGRAKSDLRIISTKSEFDGGWAWSLAHGHAGDMEPEAPGQGDV